ncbi:MAG: hypothetical protein CMJ18_00360 [Phycisphaeraceae bacterium]|nr:hypothetical protein [Phycisphaeraceae bacterium]
MTLSSSLLAFDPFETDHLGRDWQIQFGVWRVVDGRLCQVLPDGPDPDANLVISGSGLAGALARLGAVRCNLPEGGFQRVHVTFEASLATHECFAVGLDEWAVEWAPDFGMRPMLTDATSASRGHECVDEPWGPADTTHRIELIGDRETITFRCDGRDLFSTPRRSDRPYRALMIHSYAGPALARMRIERQGSSPARRPARRADRPLLAATVDFLDDILYEPFTTGLIDRLVERLAELDIGRIYFHHTTRVRPEALGPDADPQLSRSLDQWKWGRDADDGSSYGTRTVRNCYPFLPKAVDSAHRRGMQVYAVIKPMDMHVGHPTGGPSPFFNEHLFQSRPDASMQRWMPPEMTDDRPERRPVATLRFRKDDDRDHGVRPEQITVWTSDDNESYRPVEPPPKISMELRPTRFRRHWEGGWTDERPVQTITIDGLHLTSRYFAVTVDGDRAGTFRNRVYRLAEILDAEGQEIPVTHNLLEFPRDGDAPWRGEGGFVFTGFTTSRQPTASWIGRDWIEMLQALDGIDRGIAFERGVRESLVGAPDPANPVVREYWMDWLVESLDAGVDGIDLRIIHHNNPMDWANYGFSGHVADAYERRFGGPLRPEAACRHEHAQLLGEVYTEFVREASRVTRQRGAKMQHHVSVPMDSPPHIRPMTGIQWDWRRWIEEGLLDAVTLKNLDPDSCFFDEVMAVAERHGVETIHCPYLNCILNASDTWPEQLRAVVENVTRHGMDGLILYESASFLNANGAGEIEEVLPNLRDILRPEASSSSI